MDLTKHCQVCEHQLHDMISGTRCGLTNEKPSFKNKCPEISFGIKYEHKIREVNIEYELVKRTKEISIANFIFFISISAAVIVGGYFLGIYAFDNGVISTGPLIIMGVGASIIPLGSGPLNKYITGMKVAKKKKVELDELLANYNIQYTIDVIVKKDLHGNEDITTNLQFLRKYYR